MKSDYTKKLDAESRICYDSTRNDSVFFGKAKAAGLRLQEERSRAPVNRTHLVNLQKPNHSLANKRINLFDRIETLVYSG